MLVTVEQMLCLMLLTGSSREVGMVGMLLLLLEILLCTLKVLLGPLEVLELLLCSLVLTLLLPSNQVRVLKVSSTDFVGLVGTHMEHVYDFYKADLTSEYPIV